MQRNGWAHSLVLTCGRPRSLADSNNAVAMGNGSGFGFDTPLPEAKQRQLRHGYFAATSFIDAQVGRVLAGLTKYGYLDNTVVTLWSDHGISQLGLDPPPRHQLTYCCGSDDDHG